VEPILIAAIVAAIAVVVTVVALVSRRSGGAPPAAPPTVAPAPGPAVETTVAPGAPEAPGQRLRRLRARLPGTGGFASAVHAVLGRDRLDEQTWDELEDTLIMADLGLTTSHDVMADLRRRAAANRVADPAALTPLLREELLAAVDPNADRDLSLTVSPGVPAVVMVVGVNGTGKTTTTGKLARLLVAEDHDVLLAAADTFRAAASEQLQTWGDGVGVPVVRGPEGGDPGSVAFEAVSTGISDGCDVVIVDTAGRLHTKTGLMAELGKVKRVIEKQAPVSEVLLVIDATTGQNGLAQARVFADAVDITGIVLTKLDGSAKGGIVVAVQRELGVPVKFVGLGEGPDDLAPFDATMFVDALLGDG